MVIYCVSIVSILLVRSTIPGAAGITVAWLCHALLCAGALAETTAAAAVVEIRQSIKNKPESTTVLLCEDTHALNPVWSSSLLELRLHPASRIFYISSVFQRETLSLYVETHPKRKT